MESSDAKAKGGAVNAGTESGVSTEGRTGTAAEGADSDGDTGARLDVIRSGDDSEASQAGELGRGGTGVHGVIRLSETEKRIITDSGNAVVELEDFTSEPAVFSSALTAARDYAGAQENTRQADVEPETEALFSAENALRFAVSGAPHLPGKSSARYGAEYAKPP